VMTKVEISAAGCREGLIGWLRGVIG